MNRPALAFDEIRVERMPGFVPPGFVVGDLSSGINVVWGPNGSGKSTLARAMASLLWPREEAPERAALTARLRAGDDPWVFRVDAGTWRRERDGIEAEPPPLPPASVRDRYRLALHELLQASAQGRDPNRSFAEAILSESVGGFRIAEAAGSLGFRPRPSQPKALLGKLRDAEARLGAARGEEGRVREDETRLDDLRARCEAARDAVRRAEVLALALERAKAREADRDAAMELEAYPAVLEGMTGVESEDVEALGREIDRLREEIREVERTAGDARREIAGAALPPGGVPDHVLAALRERIDGVVEAEASISAEALDLAAIRERLAAEASRLGEGVDGERVARIDLSGIRRIAEVARRAAEFRARRTALLERERILAAQGPPCGSPAVPATAVPADTLREACQILRRWLRSPEPRGAGALPSLRILAAAGGLLAAALALLLAASAGWAWGIAALPGLSVAVVALRAADADRRALDARRVHEESYRALGLGGAVDGGAVEEGPVGGPARWEAGEVERFALELERRLAEALLREERARSARELRPALQDLDRDQEDLAAQRRAVAEALGVAPSLEEEGLAWLVDAVGRFQGAEAEERGASARLVRARELRDELLAEVAGVLADYGYAQASDRAEAAGMLEDLQSRRGRADRAVATLREAEKSLTRLGESLREKEAGLTLRFEKLGLPPGDEATLARWCREHAGYRGARARREGAARDLARAEERLRAHVSFDEGLTAASAADLEVEREAANALAGTYTDLLTDIAGIEAVIERAKRGHAVEDALTERDRCLDALADQAREESEAVIGSLLAERLERLTRDAERPAVFHEARRLFAEVTRGRYRLELEGGDVPTFRAVDAETGLGQGLDELSSATRVQLLLSVRVAFVQRQEGGLALPLVLDETLANSDAVRARAVMEAVVALARAGRQVFAFTAQEEEVAKWESLLTQSPEVPFRKVDLAEVRRLSYPGAGAFVPRPETGPRRVLDPGAMRHDEYGRALEVPAIDPLLGPGAAHAWYVVDEPAALCALLGAGVERAGQIRSLVECGGGGLLGVSGGARRRAEGALRALGIVCELAGRGRRKPVDRAALLDSEAVTDVFLERVADLARQFGGDARKLLEALREGRVKRLRAESIEKLAGFLEEKGYLPRESPLDADELRVQALGALAGDLASGAIDPARIERILDGLAPRP